jgi:ABC-2 type transport system ATP-binding protein
LLKADGGSVHIGNIDVSRSEEWKMPKKTVIG